MLRTIVTCATYRQSSASTPGCSERDPDNRLLARGPRFRLEAEMVRDAGARASAGCSCQKIGGPSVFPAAARGLWNGPYSATHGLGHEHRRGPLPPRPLHVLAAHVALPELA